MTVASKLLALLTALSLLSGCMSIAVTRLGEQAIARCQHVQRVDIHGGDPLASPSIAVACTAR